jgi:hypothetical protein
MMATAEALPIGWVIGSTTILPFPDVVCEHAMRWLCLGASPAILRRLAAPARTGDDSLPPCPILIGQIERIDRLGLRLDGPAIKGLQSAG